jgi:hypothetical protein
MRGLRTQVDRFKRDVRGVVRPDRIGAFIICGPKERCLLFVQPGRHGNLFSFHGKAAACFYRRWKAADQDERERLIVESTESQTCCASHMVPKARVLSQ